MEADLPVQTEAAEAGERPSATTRGAHDPFAGDLFAADRPAHDRAAQGQRRASGDGVREQRAGAARRALWHTRLPRVTASQVRLSAQLDAALRPSLSDAVMEAVVRVLARYTQSAAGEVELGAGDTRECEFAAVAKAPGPPRVWALLGVAPGRAGVAAEVDAGFAAGLVDRILGGAGSLPDSLRPLSPMERAVAEFLWLNLLREANEACGEPVWSLTALSPEPPAWMSARRAGDVGAAPPASDAEGDDDATPERGLSVSVRVRVKDTAGLVRFYLPPEALDALSETLRRRQSDADDGAGRGDEAERLAALTRIAPHVRVRPVLGETEVTAAELAALECGDVVLVARPLARPDGGGALTGRLEVLFGDGVDGLVVGRLGAGSESDADEAGEDGAAANDTGAGLSLLIDEVRRAGGPPTPAEQLNMSEMAEDGQEGAAGVALEDLWLTVRVELASRRIGLEELARLRVGQLLELGCKATDPVDLVLEGRRVARGELVDIEGQLGVRVTQLSG